MAQMRLSAPNQAVVLTMEIFVAGSLTIHPVGEELLPTLGLLNKVVPPLQELDRLLTTPKVLFMIIPCFKSIQEYILA